MKQTDEQTQARKVVAQAIEKSWSDEKFKEHLLTNPLSAINSLTEETFEFPAGKEVVFIDESDTPESTESIVYVNITERNLDDMELTEEQLEAVAGGVADGGCIPLSLPIVVSGDDYGNKTVL
mgnify:CR=1 FL=1